MKKFYLGFSQLDVNNKNYQKLLIDFLLALNKNVVNNKGIFVYTNMILHQVEKNYPLSLDTESTLHQF
jgi:hypothetical protein